jgi:hypothetical protein
MKSKFRIQSGLLICALSAQALISIGCGNSLSSPNAGGNGTIKQRSTGVVREKSLSLPQGKTTSLLTCSSDNSCRSNEICAELDLNAGAEKKCIESPSVCLDASCTSGRCISLTLPVWPDKIFTKVTCIEGGDQSGGVIAGSPGSAPGNSGGDTPSGLQSFALVISALKNIIATSSAFTFEAKDSSGELIRVSVNLPTGSACHSEAVRAANGKVQLTIFGEWKALKVDGFAGNTYQFSRADFCYSGEAKSVLPEI